MHPYLMSLIAQERHAQFLEEAEQHRLGAAARRSEPSMWSQVARAVLRWRRPRPAALAPSVPQVLIDLTDGRLAAGGAVGADDHAGAGHFG